MSETVEEIIGYVFEDKDLLRASLLHGSSGKSGFRNERLETLGDAVITLVITEELFHRFPEANEGGITRMKSALVSSRTLASIAGSTGVLEHARTGDNKKRTPASISANIFEALIGAVYIDGGLDNARSAILKLFGNRLYDSELARVDPKSRLQHILQRSLKVMPVYEVIGVKGPPHGRTYRVRAVIAGRAYPAAEARSKKSAEKKAARLALAELEREEQ